MFVKGEHVQVTDPTGSGNARAGDLCEVKDTARRNVLMRVDRISDGYELAMYAKRFSSVDLTSLIGLANAGIRALFGLANVRENISSKVLATHEGLVVEGRLLTWNEVLKIYEVVKGGPDVYRRT